MSKKDNIISMAGSKFIEDLTNAESKEDFNNILLKLGYIDLLLEEDYWQDTLPYGKILIMGDLSIKQNDMLGCLKKLGISKDRVEHISYEQLTNYNIESLEYRTEYRLIVVGPVPHKCKGIGNSYSMLSSIENNPNITKVKRCYSGEELKITKTSLKKVISDEISNNFLQVS